VHPIARIFACKTRNPSNPSRHKIWVVFADWSHWTGLGARGGREEHVGLLLEAGASLENAFIIANCWLSRLPIVYFLWPVSAAVSEQIGYLSSSRSRRSSWIRQWCPIVWIRAALATGHGGFPGIPYFVGAIERRSRHSHPFWDRWPRLDGRIPLRLV
jgi:hypothetical protein